VGGLGAVNLVEGTDQVLLPQIEGTTAARSLWADAAATSVLLASGTNVATVTLGAAGSTVTIPGSLTVSGTATAISTANLTVADTVILGASGAATGNEAGIAFERGSTGDDSILLWNEADARFELGFFNTVGGTVTPTGALVAASDLRAKALSLAGTLIAADGALGVQANGANDLTLSARGTSYNVSATGAALSTTAQDLVGAINEVAAAALTGVTEDGGSPNVVTVTDALVVGAPASTVATGASDIVAGLAGGYFLHYAPSAAQLFFGEDFGGGQTYLGLYASENGTQIDMVSDAVIGWSPSTTTIAGNAQDTRLSRSAAGEVLVDDGAGGAATLTAATVKLGTGGPTLTDTSGTVTASGQLLADSLASGATHVDYSATGDLFCGPTTDSVNSSFRWDSSNLAAYFSNGSGLSAISMSPSNASVSLGSNGGLYFAETTSIASAKDASITRAAAGVVKIGNGVGGDGTLEAATVQLGSGGPTLTDSSGVPLSSTGLFAGTLGAAIPASFAAGDAYFGATTSHCLVYDQSAGTFDGFNNSDGTSSVWQFSTAVRGLQLGTGFSARLRWAPTGNAAVPDVSETGWKGTLVDATATTILTVTCATETSASGVIDVAVHATDGTDMQARVVTVRYAVVNKAGAVTSFAAAIDAGLGTGPGSLTVTADSTDGAGVATIRLTATSSLTTTSLVANCHVRHLGGQPVSTF
jgi:hypothetical protein